MSTTVHEAKTGGQPVLTVPTFTPRTSSRAPETAPMAALPASTRPAPPLARPYAPANVPAPVHPVTPLDPAVWVTAASRPVIGDAMKAMAPAQTPAPASFPMPDGQPPHVPSPSLPDSLLCSSPGWAKKLMKARVRNGEWENVFLIVEHGWEANAADEAAQHFRVRLGIAKAAAHLAAALGQPEMADMLARRVREVTVAARGAA